MSKHVRADQLLAFSCGSLAFLGLALLPERSREARAAELDAVKAVESQRIAVINKVRPAVVAVFGRQGSGGGSGVLISKDGYALTNFHVVAPPIGPLLRCGLSDGNLYDGVVVGTDKVGDISLIKLLPKKEGDAFPFADLGDSDAVKVGDWALAMGNPFLLATDFNPSVSFGLVSGVNRYQYPEGGFLEYTDCLQVDTAINPGNSGGPLFNMKGEVIGINGRIMFEAEKRFRINSGFGYSISSNQIKNFLGHLHAGLDADHATLGARVETPSEDADLSQMVVKEVLEDSDTGRRGLQEGDELISFAGRPITSVNQYKNILGIFPKEWRLPLVYRKGGKERKEILVRLMSYQTAQALMPRRPQPKDPNPAPQPKEQPLTGPAAKFYKAKKGFANFYFNEQQQNRVLEGLKKHGDFTPLAGNWVLEGTYEMEGRLGDMRASITEEKDPEDPKNLMPVARIKLNAEYDVEPLKKGLSDVDLAVPPQSGGLLVALYNYRRFLTLGPKGFEGGNFAHGGQEPFYPMPLDASAKQKSFKDLRVMTEVIRTEHAGVAAKWYFFRKDLNLQLQNPEWPEGALVGFEVFISKDSDPCEVYLHDYRQVNGRLLPHKIEIRNGDRRYAVLTMRNFQMSETPKQ
jgi:serine protease Do